MLNRKQWENMFGKIPIRGSKILPSLYTNFIENIAF